MKAKIIAILVMTLLIATTLPAIGMTIKKIEKENPPALQNGAVDQEQTTGCGYGMQLRPPYISGQSFKPTQEPLTNVQLRLFKFGTPPAGVEITVSIRHNIDGGDLTAKTINADDVEIKSSGTWVWFNFEDITLIPEETYYIVCNGSAGSDLNTYCWLFGLNDTYTRGEGWWYNDTAARWITLWEAFDFDPEWPEPDHCFKTYFKQSRDKTINKPFLNFLQSHPNMFPILQKLIQRLGLQ